MVRILLPDNNQAERRYATELLLKEFLGLNFEIVCSKNRHYILELENGARLIVEDHFFSKFPSDKSYLDSKNIPLKVQFQSKNVNPFIPENGLPIIFGHDKMYVSATEIVCGVDIFASAFFMLTRWEEYACKERDHLGRFPAKASLAGRAGFLHRPVVNEFVEMLWNMLRHLGIQQERVKRSFQLLLTHDVDYPLLWTSFPFFLKKLGGDILKRRSLKEAAFSINSFVSTKTGKEKDPYDTFDFLMQVAENANFPAHFFFMAGGKSRLDPKYDIGQDFVKKLMAEMYKRGHRIGFHPSFDTFDDETLFQREKLRLEEVSPQAITCGRQHFLRFSVPETWRIWADSGMEWDSTLGYPEQEGFRCGVCYPFPVFDILERKELKLLEIPLTAMDTTYAVYKKVTPAVMEDDLMELFKTVKKYSGTFVLLWHNSSFGVPAYQAYTQVYERFLKSAAKASS